MAKKERTPLHWARLDNAAKIYPAARRRNWTNLFRQSVTLKEEVDTQILQRALDITVKRFPTMAARLRKGVFWYYLHQVAEAPKVGKDYSYPLVYMDKKEITKCAFRVLVYRNRIAVEYFHSLTDGTGALVFLKTLTAEYLEQKYGITVPAEKGVLSRTELPRQEELEDSFLRIGGTVPISRKDTDAWRITGTPTADGFQHLTCFTLPVQTVLELAHRHGCSVTVFLSAVMMLALMNLQQQQEPNPKKRKGIKLLIPVNLRNLFPSKTLRNFAMYTVPELDPRLGDYSFQEICDLIRHKMGTEVTPKHMSRVIATNVGDERNPLVRLIPLPVKNMVMKAIFNAVGERKSCLTLSNLGQVRIPQEMEAYVERFDFILGVQASAPYNCGVLSYGENLYVNIIRNICEPALEQHFYWVLREMGVPVTVESNGRK